MSAESAPATDVVVDDSVATSNAAAEDAAAVADLQQAHIEKEEVSLSDTPSSSQTTSQSSQPTKAERLAAMSEEERIEEEEEESVLNVTSSSVEHESCGEETLIVLPNSPPASQQRPPAQETLYSSLPPDLNSDIISRSTKSCMNGENLSITRGENGMLVIMSITAAERGEKISNYPMCYSSCVVCERKIKPGEMFLNFPDDLDRRRMWGNHLGFQYKEMLRVKSGVIPLGNICTDHFAPECFRLYNYNKAAIETFGFPSGVSPSVKTTIKRIPWSCTICSFSSFSVADTHAHMLDTHMEKSAPPEEVSEMKKAGYHCPFCRKCGYGYKTLTGFKRHMNASPLDHSHLKRVVETARAMCRAEVLNPCDQWESWTESKVSLAYYGCEPPRRSPQKRKRDSVTPAATPTVRTAKDGKPGAATATAFVSPAKHLLSAGGGLVAVAATPRLVPVQLPAPSGGGGGGGEKRPETMVDKTSDDAPPTLQLQCEKKLATRLTLLHRGAADGSSRTLAEALGSVMGDETQLPPTQQKVVDGPLFQVNREAISMARMRDLKRKTRRQIESTEARLRLFGDSAYVELPEGYSVMETQEGPRLVESYNDDDLPIALPKRRVTILRKPPGRRFVS